MALNLETLKSIDISKTGLTYFNYFYEPSDDQFNSIIYPQYSNLSLFFGEVSQEVTGTITVFLGLSAIEEYDNVYPITTIPVYYGYIYGSVDGFFNIDYLNKFNTKTYLVVQWVPDQNYVYSGSLNVRSTVNYAYPPSLPPEGYWLTTIDPITGLIVPLIRFVPPIS